MYFSNLIDKFEESGSMGRGKKTKYRRARNRVTQRKCGSQMKLLERKYKHILFFVFFFVRLRMRNENISRPRLPNLSILYNIYLRYTHYMHYPTSRPEYPSQRQTYTQVYGVGNWQLTALKSRTQRLRVESLLKLSPLLSTFSYQEKHQTKNNPKQPCLERQA